MRKVEFGPNGDRATVYDALDLIAFLEEGGEVRVGSFSGATGYSGWWDSYRVEGDRLVLVTDQTDTSHYDPARVQIYEAPWPILKGYMEALPPQTDAEEAFSYARHRAWEEGLFTLVYAFEEDQHEQDEEVEG